MAMRLPDVVANVTELSTVSWLARRDRCLKGHPAALLCLHECPVLQLYVRGILEVVTLRAPTVRMCFSQTRPELMRPDKWMSSTV